MLLLVLRVYWLHMCSAACHVDEGLGIGYREAEVKETGKNKQEFFSLGELSIHVIPWGLELSLA